MGGENRLHKSKKDITSGLNEIMNITGTMVGAPGSTREIQQETVQKKISQIKDSTADLRGQVLSWKIDRLNFYFSRIGHTAGEMVGSDIVCQKLKSIEVYDLINKSEKIIGTF